MICNLKTIADYQNAINLAPDHIKSIIETFNPDNTIFLNNGFGYTTSDGKVNKVVYMDRMVHIPNVNSDIITKLPDDFKISNQVLKTIEKNSSLEEYCNGKIKRIGESDIKKIEILYEPIINNADKGKVPTFVLGEYYNQSTYQEITDVYLSSKEFVDSALPIGSNKFLFTTRKITVSYFNENGLFARGELIYSIEETIKE